MVHKGQRCTIRPWRSTDAESLVRHANNLEVARHLRDRFPHPYTRADAQAFLKHAVPASVSDRPTNLAIEVDGEAAGGIGFILGSDVERFSAEIGYWLGQAYWGRGIGTEALIVVSQHAFDDFNLLRLYALAFAGNVASTRVLEKAGYVREGLLRSSSVKFGQPHDQYVYAKINSAWRFE